MLELLAFTAFGGLVLMALAGAACLVLVMALVWLVTWPIRLLFRGVIGLIGLVVGLVVLPVLLIAALLVGAVVLLPLALLALPLLLLWCVLALILRPALV